MQPPKWEQLDAWKGCHELCVATLKLVRGKKSADDILRLLSGAALRAVGRVAFGAGSGDRRMLLRSLYAVQGWLWSYAAHLEVARVMGVLTEQECINLDALRGRASFYTVRHLDRTFRPKS